MAISLEDRAGDAVLSDGAGTYVHGEAAIVELQDWEIQDDQMYVKSAPGANSRNGRIVLAGLDVECVHFQLRVYSSSEFLELPLGEAVLATGLVMCRPLGPGKKDEYRIDIGECVAVHRVAENAWRVISETGCVGRLSKFKQTIGDYDVPFEFLGVLN
jgi:hypothetical protein